jgi:uncharacterized protein YdeI (YjbR/CyaY-like superfamily)
MEAPSAAVELYRQAVRRCDIKSPDEESKARTNGAAGAPVAIGRSLARSPFKVMEAKFFKTPAEFRKWLEKNHAEAQELWVGYYKKDSRRPSLTWPQSVDEALCFGWIDGVRKSLDEVSYMIRFTPRKPRSVWSNVNIKRVEELSKAGVMQPAGLKAFEQRKQDKSGIYAYEQKEQKLGGDYEQKLKANTKAWEFFHKQAPWYQRTVSWWVISAKKEETRQKRLDQLIAASAEGRTVSQFTRTSKLK